MTQILKTKKGKKVVLLDAPIELRINKKLGVFTYGMVEDGNPDSLATNGRGKLIEGFPVKIHTNLFGKIGQGQPTQWAYVTMLVTGAQDKRIYPGTLISFACYRFEEEFFSKAKVEAELADIFEQSLEPQVLKIEFSQSISTKHGSSIKPPSFSYCNPDELEKDYYLVVDEILEKYPQYLPDPLTRYPAVYDKATGELVEGLVSDLNHEDNQATLEASEPKQLTAKK